MKCASLPARSSVRGWLAMLVVTAAGCAFLMSLLGGSDRLASQAHAQDGANRVQFVAPPPPPPPIYGPREIADAELAVLDTETQYAFWTTQEEKWEKVMNGFGDSGQSNEKEIAFARQALQIALRAQSSKIDAGLQRERSTKRLEAMRAKNVEVQGGEVK